MRKRAWSSKELIRYLEQNGFGHVRTRGSHHVMKRGGLSIPVPHPEKDLPLGTDLAILKQAGLD